MKTLKSKDEDFFPAKKAIYKSSITGCKTQVDIRKLKFKSDGTSLYVSSLDIRYKPYELEFIKLKPNNMLEGLKNELRTGMRVEYDNGDVRFVNMDKDRPCFISENGKYVFISEYSASLKTSDSEFNIAAIYAQPRDAAEYINLKYRGKLFWERKVEKPICEIDGIKYSEDTLRSIIRKANKLN